MRHDLLHSPRKPYLSPPESSVSARCHGLDSLRSVAILSVMSFHVYELHAAQTIPAWLVPAVKTCWAGVDLFFVLSGYLIGLQLLRSYSNGAGSRNAWHSLWIFYFKRFFRVLPAYAVVLGLYLAVPMWREAPRISAPWEFATFTENFFVNYPVERAFSHVWSLCVEEHFYLVLPILVLLMSRRATLARTVCLVTGVVLLGIAFRAFVLFHWLRPLAEHGQSFLMVYVKQIYYPTYSRLDGLVAGVVLALIRIFRATWWAWIARHGHSFAAAGICLIGFALWLTKDRFVSVNGASAWGVVFGFPLLSFGLALLVASAMSDNGILSRYRVPGARLIATLAFTLYLSHKGILHLGVLALPGLSARGGLPWFLLFGASSLAAAGLLYWIVERPFMLLRDRLLKRYTRPVESEMRAEPAL
jgi:peptidoglycan/LPS O-acetylase OafA/YrhL